MSGGGAGDARSVREAGAGPPPAAATRMAAMERLSAATRDPDTRDPPLADPGGTDSETQSALDVLLSALGLAIWAAHFGVVYAANALACERGWAEERLLGLPLVPTAVALATLAALGGLALVFRASVRGMRPPYDVAGEEEPRFTRWFAAATCALSALAVVFETVPAFVVPPCG